MSKNLFESQTISSTETVSETETEKVTSNKIVLEQNDLEAKGDTKEKNASSFHLTTLEELNEFLDSKELKDLPEGYLRVMKEDRLKKIKETAGRIDYINKIINIPYRALKDATNYDVSIIRKICQEGLPGFEIELKEDNSLPYDLSTLQMIQELDNLLEYGKEAGESLQTLIKFLSAPTKMSKVKNSKTYKMFRFCTWASFWRHLGERLFRKRQILVSRTKRRKNFRNETIYDVHSYFKSYFDEPVNNSLFSLTKKVITFLCEEFAKRLISLGLDSLTNVLDSDYDIPDEYCFLDRSFKTMNDQLTFNWARIYRPEEIELIGTLEEYKSICQIRDQYTILSKGSCYVKRVIAARKQYELLRKIKLWRRIKQSYQNNQRLFQGWKQRDRRREKKSFVEYIREDPKRGAESSLAVHLIKEKSVTLANQLPKVLTDLESRYNEGREKYNLEVPIQELFDLSYEGNKRLVRSLSEELRSVLASSFWGEYITFKVKDPEGEED